MSTPEHTPNPTGAVPADAAGELETRQARDVAIYTNATDPTRTTSAVSWLGWHVGELAGVIVPLGLAVTAWDGFYAVSGLAALAWAAHEVRLHQRKKTARTTNPHGSPGSTEVATDE